MNLEITIELALGISIPWFLFIAGATWKIIHGYDKVSDKRDLALAKNTEDQIELEVDYREKLDLFSSPENNTEVESRFIAETGLRKHVKKYIEERNNLFSKREIIRKTIRPIRYFREQQFIVPLLYFLALIVIVSFQLFGHSRFWIYLILWVYPLPFVVWFYLKQEKLIRIFDNE